MSIHFIKEIIALKPTYKIKLYRSPLFKIILSVGLITTIVRVFLWLYFIRNYAAEGNSIYDVFFPPEDIFNLSVPTGFMNIVQFILTVVFSLAWIYILVSAIFVNKITVCDEYIKIRYAPRLYGKVINKDNIRMFVPVKSSELSFGQKLLNFNFAREHLYKIVCYNYEFIITCNDTEPLNRLIREIDIARANKTTKEITDENKISDWAAFFSLFIIAVYILDLIRAAILF